MNLTLLKLIEVFSLCTLNDRKYEILCRIFPLDVIQLKVPIEIFNHFTSNI